MPKKKRGKGILWLRKIEANGIHSKKILKFEKWEEKNQSQNESKRNLWFATIATSAAVSKINKYK